MNKTRTSAIKSARERLGITQTELGSEVGLSGASISRIERGEWFPSVATLMRLGVALGVPWPDLVED